MWPRRYGETLCEWCTPASQAWWLTWLHRRGGFAILELMKINEEKGKDGYLKFSREGRGEDLFFLSNGHISPLFYSVLARRGYFGVDELSTFRKINSRL